MKRLAISSAVLAALLAVGCNSEKAKEEKPVAPEAAVEQAQSGDAAATFADERAEQSYAIGAFMGQQITRMTGAYQELGIELDAKLIEKGVMESLGGKSSLDDASIQKTLQTLETERMEATKVLQEKMEAERQAKLGGSKSCR